MKLLNTIAVISVLIIFSSCTSNSNSNISISELDSAANKSYTKSEQPNIPKDSLLKLSGKSKVSVGPLAIQFEKFAQSKQFIFDRYPTYSGTEWRLYTAERGNKYLTSNIEITSSEKEPLLPCIFLYKYDNGSLIYVGTFDYKLYHWEDYATYLGNYHDNHNDFKYQTTVKFSIGFQVDEKMLMSSTLLVLLKKQNSIERSEDRFENPPVQYSASNCITPDYNSLNSDFLKDFEVVALINKDKIK